MLGVTEAGDRRPKTEPDGAKKRRNGLFTEGRLETRDVKGLAFQSNRVVIHTIFDT